jgi:osmotically-inducible protein OsmY
MSIEQHTETEPRRMRSTRESELARRIETHIDGVAHGRVRDLQVTCLEGTVILEGRTRTYHDKQRAQEAALTLTSGQALLANHIVVAR